MKSRLLHLLCLLSLPLMAAASQGADKPRFRTLGLGGALEGLYYTLDGKDVPVSVTEDARSGFFSLPAGNAVEFYRMAAGPDGKPSRQSVISVKLPGSASSLVLIVFSVEPGGKISAFSLPEDIQSFPGGAYLFMNRSGQPLTCVVAGTVNHVPDMSEAVLKNGIKPDARTAFVQILMTRQLRDAIAYSGNWAWNSSTRTLIVTTPPLPPSDTPSVRRIVENLDAIEAQPQPPAANP